MYFGKMYYSLTEISKVVMANGPGVTGSIKIFDRITTLESAYISFCSCVFSCCSPSFNAKSLGRLSNLYIP